MKAKEKPELRVLIESDGTPNGTKVLDADTGRDIPYVSLDLDIRAPTHNQDDYMPDGNVRANVIVKPTSVKLNVVADVEHRNLHVENSVIGASVDV